MTCLFTLLGLLVVAFLFGPWVLAGLQYRRHREQSARLTQLEGELARVRASVERVAVAGAAQGAAVAPAAAPAVLAAGASTTEPIDDRAAAAAIAAGATAALPMAAAAMGQGTVTFDGSVAGAGSGAPTSPMSSLPSAPAAPPAPPSGPPADRTGAAEPPSGGGALSGIEWERWIGVRGAAVLGGVVLALAGILFVRYSIERGLISPALRVAMGILTGLAAIGWSQRLRSRGYKINADALAGAGIVLLYAAVWASHSLYGFVGAPLAYALMSLITVACGLLSWRNASQLIAVLGLVGGFATPFLLASKTDNPIGLFGYVLLLDLGLILLARRRGWSALTLLALAGTLFYQGFWLLTRMRAETALLGLAIIGLFGLVFGFAGWSRRQREEGAQERAGTPSVGWIAAEVVGLLAPFVFALHFASRADLGPRLYPVAALLLLLSLAAQWLSRRQGASGSDLLAAGAAAGSLAVVLVWSWDVEWTPALVWEAVAICVVLAAAFHLFFELDVRAGRSSLSTLVATAGFLGLLVLNSLDWERSPWPWVLGWALTAAMVARQSIDERRNFTPLIAALGIGAGFAGWFLVAGDGLGMPPPELYFGVAVLVGAAFQILGLAGRGGQANRFTDIGAAVFPAVILLSLAADGPATIAPALFLVVTLVLALLIVLAVTRLESGQGYLLAMMLLALTHTIWAASESAREVPLLGLAFFLATVVAFAFWPSVVPRLGRSPAAWIAAALAAPVWFWAMHRLFVARFGDGAIGLLPLVLAAITLGAAYRGRRTWIDATRTAHLAWFGAIALGLVAIAVPLQLDREWITVGWALEGLAVTALWRRLDHPGLKYFALALFAAVTARLLVNPEVLSYHQQQSMPVLNWLAYTYLVPAACLLGAARILSSAAATADAAATPSAPARPLEVARARSWEDPLYSSEHAILAAAMAVSAILVVFAWINLTIIDAFGSGPTISLSLDRLPARDLTLSLAWVVYAVVLLGFGMARDSGALRWLSLGFLVLSIGKVFLYDLGELKDLYRVASLVGLAFSLILVSLAYQRFVFRRRPAAEGG